MPMGAATMAYVLWTRFLRHNPANPRWPDRDRFILSAGHGSMLLYGLLGMVFDALAAENITADSANIYVIGDRASDLLTALNINGFGILIPFKNEPGEEEKVRELDDQRHIYIARNMIDAAEFISKREACFAQMRP